MVLTLLPIINGPISLNPETASFAFNFDRHSSVTAIAAIYIYTHVIIQWDQHMGIGILDMTLESSRK